MRRRANNSNQLLLATVGIPVALVVVVAALIWAANNTPDSRAGNRAPANDGKHSPASDGKREPPSDGFWHAAVRKYLDATERRVVIEKMYAPESIIGARYYLYRNTLIPVGPEKTKVPVGPESVVSKCRAVRCEYVTDEGFEQTEKHDTIFIVLPDGRIDERIPTRDYVVGKPGDAKQYSDPFTKDFTEMLDGH